MENEDREETVRLQFTVKKSIADNFAGFRNGAREGEGLQALLYNAEVTGFAPFGINEKKELDD